MSERKYTDEEIVKALAIHSDKENPCVGLCPYSETPYCGSDMARDALDLINRQKVEIAVLTTAVDNSTKEFLKLHDEYQDQKADIDKLQEVNADLNESLRLAAEANKDLKAEIEELEYDRKLIFDEGASWYAKANDLQIELDAMRGAANSYKMRYEKAKSAVEERKANAPVAEMTEGK